MRCVNSVTVLVHFALLLRRGGRVYISLHWWCLSFGWNQVIGYNRALFSNLVHDYAEKSKSKFHMFSSHNVTFSNQQICRPSQIGQIRRCLGDWIWINRHRHQIDTWCDNSCVCARVKSKRLTIWCYSSSIRSQHIRPAYSSASSPPH